MFEDLVVSRKTVISGSETTFKFDVTGYKYIIKNFTEGNIFVCTGSIFDLEKSTKIPQNCGQSIYDYDPYNSQDGLNEFIVKSDTDGEVEVFCISCRR